MKRRIFSTMSILLGLIIILYPTISEKYQIYKQEKLIEEWQESLLIIDKGYEEDMEYENLEPIEIDNESIEMSTEIKLEEEIKKEKLEKQRLEEKRLEEEKIEKQRLEKQRLEKQKLEYIKKNMDGTLKIEKINLNLPILKGATKENMKISVASMESGGKIGEIGNYAIVGHRNRTYGRNFNRLEEVEEDDIIFVSDGEEEYKYTVTQKLYVLPEETWVLNSNNLDKEITLITCHPMGNPTHRLIIKGKILE